MEAFKWLDGHNVWRGQYFVKADKHGSRPYLRFGVVLQELDNGVIVRMSDLDKDTVMHKTHSCYSVAYVPENDLKILLDRLQAECWYNGSL